MSDTPLSNNPTPFMRKIPKKTAGFRNFRTERPNILHVSRHVLPDTAENLFGSFGKMLQQWNISRDPLIKLEDPEFERCFVAYGNDQVQARYILSTSLMERIVAFKKKADRPIYLSFVGSKVFVAVSYTRNLFEPKLLGTIMDFDRLCQYFEDLSLAVGIVDDLNLNTRIWTKQ